MKKSIKATFILLFAAFGLLHFGQAEAATSLAEKLKGKILLQVESNGEAWYINPVDGKRVYLGTPDDAFRVMRELGLGVSNSDFSRWGNYAPLNLRGRILIKVEDKGKAYYVNPADRKLNYLGRPADAFQVMRKLGLGITNANLNTIEINSKYALTYDLYMIEFNDSGAIPASITVKKGKSSVISFKAKNSGFSRNGLDFKASGNMSSILEIKTGETRKVTIAPVVSYSLTPFYMGTNIKLPYQIDINVVE